MIEIICNKDESDKNSHHVKEGVTSIRRPKNDRAGWRVIRRAAEGQ